MKSNQPNAFKNNKGPAFNGFMQDPLRVVFGEGVNQMICTPDALKQGLCLQTSFRLPLK